MINSAEQRVWVDASTQTSPSLLPLAVNYHVGSSCQIEALDLLNKVVPPLHTDAPANKPTSLQMVTEVDLVPQSHSFRAALYSSRQQPSLSEAQSMRSGRVISLPEIIAEKDICGVPSLFPGCVFRACTDKGQARAVSMPESLLPCDFSSSDTRSPVSPNDLHSNDSNDAASDDVCSGDSSVSTPRTVVTRSFASDRRRTPSPLSSSCDSVEFTLNRPVNLSDPSLVQSDASSSSLEPLEDSKVGTVIDDGWMTWSSSPPRPIPALHGPASLPYARCPSGAEGVIIEEQSSLPRIIWGLDSDRPNNSSSHQRRYFTKPTYNHTVKPQFEMVGQGYMHHFGNRARSVQLAPGFRKSDMQESYKEKEFSGVVSAPSAQDYRLVSEPHCQSALSPTAPEFHFTAKVSSRQEPAPICDEIVREGDAFFDDYSRGWKISSGIYPLEDLAYLKAVSNLRQQSAQLEISNTGWLSTDEPSLIDLLARGYENSKPYISNITPSSPNSVWTPVLLPEQYNLLKQSFYANPEPNILSYKEIKMKPSTFNEPLSHLHRRGIPPMSTAAASRAIDSNLLRLDSFSLNSSATSTTSPSVYPVHPPGLSIPLSALTSKISETARIDQPPATELAPLYPRHNLANPRSIPLSRLRQKNAIKLPTVLEEDPLEGHRYDVKLPNSVKKTTMHSSPLAPHPVNDILQVQTVGDERSLIDGKPEKVRVKLPAASIVAAGLDASTPLRKDALKKKGFLKKRRPSNVADDYKVAQKQTNTYKRRNVTV